MGVKREWDDIWECCIAEKQSRESRLGEKEKVFAWGESLKTNQCNGQKQGRLTQI